MDKLRRYFGVLALALFAAWTLPGATPEDTTTSTIEFAVDTRSGTRTFATTAAINAMPPIYTGSSTASAKDPNTGTTSAIASTWKPTAGGTWALTLASPSQSASITVPYDVFQTGEGTSSSPYVFKSNGEAANYAANGVYFTFGGSLAMDSFTAPTGYAVQSLGSGKYQLVTSSNVKYISEAAATFAVDSLPNPRTVKNSEVLPLTYKKDATVKITSPSAQDLVTTTTSADGAGTYNWTPADGSTTYVLSHSSDSQTATFNLSDSATHYTITWKDGVNDGAWATTSVASGTTPSHAYPTREPASAQYAWTCTGWSPTPSAASANATYTAQWQQKLRKYTITFYNGSTIIGSQQMDYNTSTALKSISSMNTTTCPKAEYGWTFAGWSTANNNTSVASADGANRAITGDLKLYALFKRTFTYTYYASATATAPTTTTLTQWWRTGAAQSLSFPKNFSDTAYDIIIDGDVVLKSGLRAAVTLTPAADLLLTYAITSFGASFDVDTRSSTRTIAHVSEILPIMYQKNAVVKQTTPTDNAATLLDAGTTEDGTFFWNPPATGTNTLTHTANGLTYTAVFNYGPDEESTTVYTITWKLDASTELGTTLVDEGSTPRHAAPTKEDDDAIYTFAGWSPTLVPATANATYTATWETVPVVAKVNDTPYASFAEARTAAGTDGSKTIVMRKADSTATTLTIGQVLKVDNTAATYSGTVSASGTNVKIVTTTSGKVTTYTCKYDLSKATVAVSGAYTYTGSAITPTYTVTLNSTTLTKGTHYTEELSNNTNAGTATITLTGTGSYDGTKTQTFTIGKASVTCPANAGSKTYNGQTQTATITAPAGSSVKTNAGGKNVGAYDVVLALTSTTNYKWSDNTTADKTIKFNITAKTLTDAMVSGVNSSYTYTGSQIKPTPTVTDSAAGITSSDYTVTWGTNTTVAQGGTVTVTAKGNYTGAVTKSFSIAKAEAVVTVAARSGLVYSGEAQALVTQSGLQGGTIAYTLDGVAGTSAIPTGIVPKSYTVGWTVTGDANHSDKSGSVTVAISGTVAGAATITLGSGVTVAIPAGVTVTVSEAQAVTAVTGGKVVVTRGGARAETNGTIAANGVITGEAVYLYGSQSEVDAIESLSDKTLSNDGTLKIKAKE